MPSLNARNLNTGNLNTLNLNTLNLNTMNLNPMNRTERFDRDEGRARARNPRAGAAMSAGYVSACALR